MRIKDRFIAPENDSDNDRPDRCAFQASKRAENAFVSNQRKATQKTDASFSGFTRSETGCKKGNYRIPVRASHPFDGGGNLCLSP